MHITHLYQTLLDSLAPTLVSWLLGRLGKTITLFFSYFLLNFVKKRKLRFGPNITIRPGQHFSLVFCVVSMDS